MTPERALEIVRMLEDLPKHGGIDVGFCRTQRDPVAGYWSVSFWTGDETEGKEISMVNVAGATAGEALDAFYAMKKAQ